MNTSHRVILYVFAVSVAIMVVCLFLVDIGGAEEITETVNATPTIIPYYGRIANVTVIEPRPGDVVYYGEIAYIFPIIGWAGPNGEYQLDYWYSGHTPGYSPADYIATIEAPRAGTYINRQTFPYPGFYYQHLFPGEVKATPVIRVEEGVRLSNETEEILHQRNITPAVVYDPWPQLPEKKSGADFLQARYQPINLTDTGATWFWVFHHSTENIYLLQQENTGNIRSDGLKPGRYDLILQWQGNVSTIGVFWYPKQKAVKCACTPERFAQEGVELGAYIEADLMRWLENQQCSDDLYEVRSLLVQEPAVDITDIFEVINTTEDHTLYVQGYTNLVAGTIINLTIDRSRWDYHTLRAHTFNTTVYGGGFGNYSRFRTKIPYDPKELKPGQHKLSAVTQYNTETSVDFWVYEIPEGMARPPARLKYIDRNLWVPTPTPEVILKTEIKKEIVVETQVQYVNITPDYAVLAGNIVWDALGKFVIAVLALVALYLVSVGWRVRK